MRRITTRMNLAGLLIALVVAGAAFNAWQRFEWGGVSVVIGNFTSQMRTFRVIDGTSGRMVGTYHVGPLAAARVAESRLDIWYRDLSPDERAAGRNANMLVQLFEGDHCELAAQVSLDHRYPEIDIEGDAFVSLLGEDVARTVVATAAVDPCAGGPAVPYGSIANRTTDPIVVGRGIAIAACTSRRFGPGDLARLPRHPPVDGAIHVHIPSIDAQDERWPLEPRTVVVSADGVSDDSFGGIGADGPDCTGHVPANAAAGN